MATNIWQAGRMKLNPTRDSQAITPYDAFLIQDSFRAIERQSAPAAERFFQELFSYDGSLKKHFAPDRWRREEVLMSTLKDVVERLNSTTKLSEQLARAANEHPAYGFSNYHHLYFGAALFSMLEAVLGARFKLVYGSWFKLFQSVDAEVKAQASTSHTLPVQREEHAFAHATAA